MTEMPTFKGGRNIALKLPERDYAATLAFYRDTLGLPVLRDDAAGATLDFGPIRLHLDRVPHQSQADMWLQVETPDTSAARAYLETKGVILCEEVEPLPEAYDGFWIAGPAGTIHLIDAEGGDNG